jgi:uncharacterized membrane protein
MGIMVTVSIAPVAVLHVLFMILEMRLWNTPTGRRVGTIAAGQADCWLEIPSSANGAGFEIA